MIKRTTKKIVALACAAALVAVSAIALSGCAFGIVTESEPPTNSTAPVLGPGDTIKDGVLTVGINTGVTPYGGLNSSNQIVGLDADFGAALADQLGLSVEFVDVGNSGKAAVTNGLVDVSLCVTKASGEEGLAYSAAYINDGTAVYCLNENLPTDITGVDFKAKTVLVESGSAAAVEMIEALGTVNCIKCDTLGDAFTKLDQGEAPYLVCNAVEGDHIARDFANISRIDFLSAADVRPSYVVCAASNTALTAAIADAVDAVTGDGIMRVLVSKWLGQQGANLLPGKLNLDILPAVFPEPDPEDEEGEEGEEDADDDDGGTQAQ